uniref:Leucine-rich repeat-containing N-terminal plant-type domain-containing protein n=1 Tax=Oryza meridionalis TaxID=40149 RepID=A0A0E0D4W9_9ORYZ
MAKLAVTPLLVILVLLRSATRLPVAEMSTAAEEEYMHRLAAATGAERLLGWKADSDPCNGSWVGVTSDPYDGNRIIRIDVRGLLRGGGTLPELDRQAGSLSHLQELDLGDNYLTDNAFSGLPHSFFRGMPELHYFSISDNPRLEEWGLWSDDLLSLTELRVFNASNANINGTLQVFLGNTGAFPALVEVSLAGNRLTGVVPETFASQSIAKLDLRGKGLSGSISFINNLASSITDLRLDHNHFSGPFPADLSGLYLLRVFSVAHNRLTGVVPPSLAWVWRLTRVSVSDNLLQGPVPELPDSVKTDFAEAAVKGSFCRLDVNGPCDKETSSLLSVAAAFHYPEILAVSWRRDDPCDGWLGIHCGDGGGGGGGGRRKAIILTGNNLTGTIPASILQMPSLRVLDVSNNALEGTVLSGRDDVLILADGNRGGLNVTTIAASGSFSSSRLQLSEATTPFLTFAAVFVALFGY